MNIFSPHSTTAASTGKAANFVPLRTILRTAEWKRHNIFAIYYDKPARRSQFAQVVLHEPIYDICKFK